MKQNQENNLAWVGRLVNTHGIKGEVRVLTSSVEPEVTFKPGTIVKIKDEEFTIKSIRFHKNFTLLMFEGIDNINQIEHLKGEKIYSEETTLNEDEFYLKETIGFEVHMNNEVIGNIIGYIDIGPYDNYVVKLKNNKETNFPILDQYVKETDIEKKRIIVDLPKEFLE